MCAAIYLGVPTCRATPFFPATQIARLTLRGFLVLPVTTDCTLFHLFLSPNPFIKMSLSLRVKLRG